MIKEETVKQLHAIGQTLGYGNLMVVVSSMMRYDNIIRNGNDRGSMHAVYLKEVRKSKRADVAKKRQKMTQNQIDHILHKIYKNAEAQ